MRQRLLGALFAVILVTVGVSAQPQVPIQQAIALLTSGTTVFTIVGVVADGYINFDTGRESSGYGFRDNAGVMQVKNEGGAWSNFTTSGGAPSDAKYIVQTAHAGLSAEQVLGSLGTALLLNTTTTGVLSAYGGAAACTNQFVTALSAIGATTCATVNLTSMVTGTLPVASGGTGATTLTGILQGNGTSAFTAVTSSTVGQVLRVTGANTSSFGAVDVDDTDAITGTVAVANGGTNLASGTSGGILGYTASGTLASSVALTASNLVLGGGAGATPTPLGSLGTTAQVLIGNAAGPPTWGSVNLATMATGTIGPTVGGTGLTSYTTGDLIQATAANTLSALASVSVGSHLRSGGVGTASAWSTTKWTNAATAGDVLYASGANTYANLAVGGTAGMFIRSTGTLPSWSTLVLPNAAAVGDIPIATTTDTLTMLTAVATGRVLCSAGVLTAPSWCISPTVTSITSGSYLTFANCLDSAGDAACGSAAAGGVVVDAGDTATVVSTSAVTANSQIIIVPDMSLGTRLTVTCNATVPTDLRVTARTAATSFTITVSAPAANPLCVNYLIVN